MLQPYHKVATNVGISVFIDGYGGGGMGNKDYAQPLVRFLLSQLFDFLGDINQSFPEMGFNTNLGHAFLPTSFFSILTDISKFPQLPRVFHRRVLAIGATPRLQGAKNMKYGSISYQAGFPGIDMLEKPDGGGAMNQLLLWGILAGACTAVGAVLLFIKRHWTDENLAAFLGLASGVMIAVVLFDMLPSALVYGGMGPVVKGVAAGILLLYLFDRCLFGQISRGETLIGLGYLIMLGIAMHDLPEGMAIALGHEMKARTGMVIALGIGIHNIPEGMAIAAPLIMGGMRRWRILMQTIMVGVITPLGTILGQMVADGLPFLLPLMLGFASGIMLYLVLFQLWPQAGQQSRRSRWYGFWLGMLIIFIATFV